MRNHRIARDTANASAVLVDLDVDSLAEAEAFHTRLRTLLADPMTPPMARADTLVAEITQAVEL